MSFFLLASVVFKDVGCWRDVDSKESSLNQIKSIVKIELKIDIDIGEFKYSLAEA